MVELAAEEALDDVLARLAVDVLGDDERVALARRALALRGRSRTGLRGVQEALGVLHEVAVPAQLYDAATAMLCAECGFDRAILFGVEDDLLVAQSVHFAQDPAWAAEVLELGRGEGRPRLSDLIHETDMLRRRAPAIVAAPQEDPRATRELVEATRTTSYVAAPIMPAGKVIGFLHADHFHAGRRVDELDRDILWAFAEGYGYAVERTLLRVHLTAQRDRLQELTGAIATIAASICDAELELEQTGRGALVATSRALAGESGLTAREEEVMQLLVAGDTNAAIARRLYISESTAKAHVKHILRKLGAANRADAVARFLNR